MDRKRRPTQRYLILTACMATIVSCLYAHHDLAAAADKAVTIQTISSSSGDEPFPTSVPMIVVAFLFYAIIAPILFSRLIAGKVATARKMTLLCWGELVINPVSIYAIYATHSLWLFDFSGIAPFCVIGILSAGLFHLLFAEELKAQGKLEGSQLLYGLLSNGGAYWFVGTWPPFIIIYLALLYYSLHRFRNARKKLQ